MGTQVEVVENIGVEGDEKSDEVLRWKKLISAKPRSAIYLAKRKQSLQARHVYGFIFFATNLLAWLVRDYGHKIIHRLHKIRVCGDKADECFHVGGVLRVSLGCFIFFSFMFVTTFGAHRLHEVRNSWHSKWWALKTIIYLVSMAVPFITPAAFIHIYGEVARIGAGICSGFLGLFLSTIFFIASSCGIVLMYFMYAPDSSCTMNIFFITWTAILVVVMMFVSLHSKVNRGLLSSAIMGSYIVFLCWSAIQSEPHIEKCRTRKKMAENGDWTTILSFFIAICAIVMATFSTGIDSQSFQFRKDEAESEDAIPYKYEMFHFVFSMGAMYFAMLFISWELDHPTRKWSIDVGWASTWVKIINEWFAASIYLWKLISPVVMRDKAISSEEPAQHVHVAA